MAAATPSTVAAQSLSREDAVAMALERNYGIQIAQSNVEIAELNDAWGAAGALPSVGFTTNVGTNVNDQSNNPASFLPYALSSNSLAPGVQLQWRLFDGMGMFAAKDRLTLLGAQANGNADLMVESTVQAVLAAYDNALVQEEAAKVLRAALDLTRQRLARVEASVNLGAAGTFDRLQFDNALWTDSTALIRQEAAVRASQRNLNLLLAQEEGVMWTLTSRTHRPLSLGRFARVAEGAFRVQPEHSKCRVVDPARRNGRQAGPSPIVPCGGVDVELERQPKRLGHCRRRDSRRPARTSRATSRRTP